MISKVFLYILFLILALDIALGYSISYYNSSFEVVDNSVITSLDILFDDRVSDVFVWGLPSDIKNLNVYVDDKAVEPSFYENKLKLNLTSVKSLRLEYETSELLDRSSFLLDLVMPSNASKVDIKLTLQEGVFLREPLKENDPLAGSIYPKPDKAITDGSRLIFVWERENMGKGDEISIYTRYRKGVNYLVYVLPIIVVIIFLSLIFILMKKSRFVSNKEADIRKHLKEDEEVIVNILKQRDDRVCEQGTLRVITGMSKASLSRLLRELEDRRVIYKEKKGKKNLVFLKD